MRREQVKSSLLLLTLLTVFSSLSGPARASDEFRLMAWGAPRYESLNGSHWKNFAQIDSCGYNWVSPVGWFSEADFDSNAIYNFGLTQTLYSDSFDSWHYKGGQQSFYESDLNQGNPFFDHDPSLVVGGQVQDDSAANQLAWFASPDSDAAGYVQWGLLAEYSDEQGMPFYSTQADSFYVDFRVKIADTTWQDTGFLRLEVVRIDTSGPDSTVYVEAESTFYPADFVASGVYQDLQLAFNRNRNDHSYLDYRVWWDGSREVWLDRLKIEDMYARQLLGGYWDTEIADIVGEYDEHLERWYLFDEPEPDQFAAQAYLSWILDSLGAHPGIHVRPNDIADLDSFLTAVQPVELWFDYYPLEASTDTCTDGGDLQLHLNGLTSYTYGLSKAKDRAIAHGIPLIYIPQAYEDYNFWIEGAPKRKRYPTGYEQKVLRWLGIAYGANGLADFTYGSRYDSCSPPSYYCPADTDEVFWYYDNDTWYAAHIRGLTYYDLSEDYYKPYEPTWSAIKEVNTVLQSIGWLFADTASWKGAGMGDTVSSVPGSFLNSVESAEFDSAWIEVAFFEDSVQSDYFLLVNRRCLSTEEQNITVYIDNAEIGNEKMWYVIDQYTQDTTFTGAIDGQIPFTTHLDPGEGKLFKLAPFPDSAFHGTAEPLTWQGGIMVDGDVTVDSGKTLAILPPAEITFYANTDVVGKGDPTDCDLIVKGGLRAIGNEIDSIIFTSTEKNPNDWEGIQVSDSATSNAVFSYCIIECAYTGIELSGPYPDTVTHSSLLNNRMHGIYWRNDNGGLVSYNHVAYDTTCYMESFGIRLFRIRNGMSSSVVTENIITNYRRGLYVDDCSTKVSSNSVSNAKGFAVCVGEQWYTSFPSYVILDNISVTGNIPNYGFYVYWNSGHVELEHCHLLPNAGHGPLYGVVFENDLVDSIYFMRRCEIRDFTVYGILSNWNNTTLDLGTTDDKGHNKIYSEVDTAWYLYRQQKSLSPVYAQYNWWGEYPPDSSRFKGNILFMPADSVEWEEPDSLQLKQAVSGQPPNRFELAQNYPNPFNPVTSVQFAVGSRQSSAHTTLKIYNILGRLVRTLVDEEKAEGSYTVYWDGRNQNGKEVSSGVYFYRLEAGDFAEVKKMVLLR